MSGVLRNHISTQETRSLCFKLDRKCTRCCRMADLPLIGVIQNGPAAVVSRPNEDFIYFFGGFVHTNSGAAARQHQIDQNRRVNLYKYVIEADVWIEVAIQYDMENIFSLENMGMIYDYTTKNKDSLIIFGKSHTKSKERNVFKLNVHNLKLEVMDDNLCLKQSDTFSNYIYELTPNKYLILGTYHTHIFDLEKNSLEVSKFNGEYYHISH